MSDQGDGRYVWCDEDRKRFESRWWACPRQLADGTLADLWRATGTSRGGGSASSVLPVLALHSWPAQSGDDWSRWGSVPIRKLAALAGLHVRTAQAGLSQLEALGLLQQRRERMERGGYRTLYRLAGWLFARTDGSDAYMRFSGQTIYGGTWMMLPTPACRHLYLVIGCLEPIGDQDAYLETAVGAVADGGDPVEEQRARHPMSLSKLGRVAGIDARTVQRTMPMLTTPMFDIGEEDIPVVIRGDAADGSSHWYAIDRRADRWRWKPDFLNDAGRVDAESQKLWPPISRPNAPRWAQSYTRTWHAWSDGRSLCGHVQTRLPGPGKTKPGPLACRTCVMLFRRASGLPA